MNLERYFGTVNYNCRKDDRGVYLDGQKIALSNSEPNGYTRYDAGEISTDPISQCSGEYNVTRPMLFVGCVPNADMTYFEKAALSVLVGGTVRLRSWTTDKGVIAESEGIDMSKFTNCGVILVKYDITRVELFDVRCDFDICQC